MQKINSDTSLRAAIIVLEAKRSAEEQALREHLLLTYESVKPINLIKSTYEEVIVSQDLKDNLINTSIGLGVGYISKTLFEGASHSPLRKLMGTALLFGITNTIKNHPEVVKSMAKSLFSFIRRQTASPRTRHDIYDIKTG